MIISVEYLEAIPAHEIFAAGIARDGVDGIRVARIEGKLLKWVAVRGGIADWAVYVGEIHHSFIDIQHNGDKVFRRSARIVTKRLRRDIAPEEDHDV